jgi:superoxide dismutase, Cu-Zn family
MAVAVFSKGRVKGEVLFTNTPKGVRVRAVFTDLPPGQHGFHIHKAGDLRGEGCKGACDHYHVGPPQDHGGPPGTSAQRHTGDLGNVSLDDGTCEKSYYLAGIQVEDLFGRSVIVHADEDDYGRGGHEDSKTTGHAGARIACAIIGRLKQLSSSHAS